MAQSGVTECAVPKEMVTIEPRVEFASSPLGSCVDETEGNALR